MNKLGELAIAVKNRIASRSNPTGLAAADLDAYTTSEMKTKYDTLIPIDTLGVSQVGDQSYFPLAIDGAADGAIGITNFRNYAIMREANGDFVGLRTATNAIKRGVYYAIARADANATITGATPSSRQYAPGLPAGWEPLTTFGASNDVMWGVALNTATGATKVYIVKLTGASSKCTVDADFWEGYTRTGAGNNTVNAIITADGVVGVMWNDNNSIPYMASYKLAQFTGDPFTELLKLTPQGNQPAFQARPVLDREVGPVTASGHVGFLSNTRVTFTKNDPENPGRKFYGYADNTWNLTYRYKSDLIDVLGFPPTGQSKVISDISTMKSFMACIVGSSTADLAGGVLSTTNLSRRALVDPDTLLETHQRRKPIRRIYLEVGLENGYLSNHPRKK